jgi:tetratricopeptide (TPR) repeat protein
VATRSVLPRVVAGAALVLMVLAAYRPALRAGFIWDDDDHVTANETLKSVDGLRRIWLEPGVVPQYYPLTFSGLWVEYHLWGLRPLGYHLVNILLHASNAILWWCILRRLAVPGAWFAAALFALHPVQVESVAWVTELKNVLSGAFYLAAALAYLRFAGLGASPAPARRRSLFYALAVALFVLALLSKTVTCSLPAALLLVVWWKRGRIAREDVVPLLPLLGLGAAFGLFTVWMERTSIGARGADWVLSFVERCLVAGRALWFYATTLVWPHPLAFIYPRWHVDVHVWWQYLFPLGAALVVIALWSARHRIGRAPITAVLFFAGTLFPALGFFNIFPMRYSFVADHFQYLACMGLIALGAAGSARLGATLGPGRRRVAATLGGTLLLVLGVLTWQQQDIYQNIEVLWRDTLAKNPTAWMAHHNLAIALEEQGRREEAATHYAEAVRLNPEYPNARLNLARYLINVGRIPEAMAHYAEVLRHDPDQYIAHFNLGWGLVKGGRLDEGIAHYREARRLNPDDAALRYNLAVALIAAGRREEAVPELRAALARRPGWSSAMGELAWILATHEDARVRNGPEAVELAERAAQRGEVAPHWILNILAAAYAEVGRYEEAVTTARRARELALGAGQMRQASVIEERLTIYAAGQPYRAKGR